MFISTTTYAAIPYSGTLLGKAVKKGYGNRKHQHTG
jgi:hypothetical protein